jgi:hypothetical protein
MNMPTHSQIERILEQFRTEGEITPELAEAIDTTLAELDIIIAAGYHQETPLYGIPAYDKERYDNAVRVAHTLRDLRNRKIATDICYLKTLLGEGRGSRALREIEAIVTASFKLASPQAEEGKDND